MRATSRELHIRTGSRLHCGLFSDHRNGGYLHQGMGMMIDAPGIEMTLREQSGSGLKITDAREGQSLSECDFASLEKRIRKTIHKCERHWSGRETDGVLELIRVIPPHIGLGSGTQLDLAVGTLWTQWQGMDATCLEISKVVDRGKRSTIGTYGFLHGGLLIDRGVNQEKETGVCRFQTELPNEWRFLLVTPQELYGYFGDEELRAFEQQPPLPENQLEQILEWLERIERSSQNFQELSEAIWNYGNLIGDSFATLQGGRYRDPICHQIVKMLRSEGLIGVAQTSWGPTIFGLCESEQQARAVVKTLERQPLPIEMLVTRPKNRGAALWSGNEQQIASSDVS